MEKELGYPTFTFNGNTYNFIPSISEFRRELDTGGYKIVKVLTASVRKLTSTGTNIFTTLPTAQNIIYYTLDQQKYRIESVKADPTGAYFRIIANSDIKGF